MGLEKILVITQFAQPTSIKSLQSFFGLINFSLKFIPKHATITHPLRQLPLKDKKFEWSEACSNSFDQLRQLVRQTPILTQPDFSKPFRLQTDASNMGIGAVLLQQDITFRRCPIAFISCSLTKPEQNYSTTE